MGPKRPPLWWVPEVLIVIYYMTLALVMVFFDLIKKKF